MVKHPLILLSLEDLRREREIMIVEWTVLDDQYDCY